MKEIVLGESTPVSELADLLDVSVTEIVKTAFTELGLMTTIHQPLSFREAGAIAVEFGFSVRRRGDPAGES
jgi:hypothetical protein